jgi:hypothetical protein
MLDTGANAGKLYGYHGAAAVEVIGPAGVLFTSGTMRKAALVYDGANARSYLDGVLGDDDAVGAQGDPPFTTLYIGCYVNGQYQLGGPISNVRIYAGALTPAQIERIPS